MGSFGKPWPAGAIGGKNVPKGNIRVRNATKAVHPDGEKFDSQLEMYLYSQLKMLGIPFERQHRIVLRDKFPNVFRLFDDRANIYSWNWYADFYFPWCGVLADAKGYPTEVAKIKIEFVLYKMYTGELEYKEIRLAKNKKQCMELALYMKGLHQDYVSNSKDNF